MREAREREVRRKEGKEGEGVRESGRQADAQFMHQLCHNDEEYRERWVWKRERDERERDERERDVKEKNVGGRGGQIDAQQDSTHESNLLPQSPTARIIGCNISS